MMHTHDMFRAESPPVVDPESGDENYTPPDIVTRVTFALGGVIDLDPASCGIAQAVVKARDYFTIADDALARPWFGRVFLNPPYSQPACRFFVRRLIADYKARHVRKAVLLMNASTSTQAFHEAAAASSRVCFPSRRIGFWRPNGEVRSQNRYDQVFFWFGYHSGRFEEAFGDFGVIGRLR